MHSAFPSPTRSPRTRRARRGIAAVLALAAVAALGASALAQGKAPALKVTTQSWGTVGGKPVKLYTLSNGSMKVKITNFGGIVQSIWVPGKNGKVADVALGFKNLAGYQKNDVYPQPSGTSGTTYFGATIGRYGNRIANAKFTLNGHTYKLFANNGPNTLHGGKAGWNKEVWTPKTTLTPNLASLALTYTSPDGQGGFPGTVVTTVTFSLGAKNALAIHYHATTDKPTVINLTNHTYFNLGGEASGTVYDQKLMINANKYTPTDDTQIPTGKLAPVAGTPFDFRKMKPIGRDINAGVHQIVLAHGYDHNWVLNRKGAGLSLAAKAVDPASGRVLTTTTTEPGVQMYTGNYLEGDLVGTSGHTYRQGDGFTLETQHFPNSPNQSNFPSTTLNPGKPYDSTTVFAFSVNK